LQNQLFESALGIAKPWYVQGVDFDAEQKTLTIRIDFVAGTRFSTTGLDGVHPVHDTVTKRLRHLNFFQHECFLEVRTPRLKLPDGKVVQYEPDWFGKLAGFTLLFEALVLAMAQNMTFAAVGKLVGLSWHRVHAICSRYVDLALAEADLSAVTAVALDETSSRRGHNYLTIAADVDERKVVFVTEGKGAKTIAQFADYLAEHKGKPEQITSVSIDMSAAFIKGVTKHLPKARITFDKFHVVAHASAAVDKMRRLARMIRKHFSGIVAWTQTRQTNGFIEALNGLFQAAKRKARGYTRFGTMRVVLFLIAGKLDFTGLNRHAQSWPGKFGQDDKWIFCLRAA
jgi:transposase